MSKFFPLPQQLVDGQAGIEITDASIGFQPAEARWPHYVMIARDKSGHLYVTIMTATGLVAMCVDVLLDFVYAVEADPQGGQGLRYFVLTEREHRLAV